MESMAEYVKCDQRLPRRKSSNLMRCSSPATIAKGPLVVFPTLQGTQQ